MEKIYFHKKNKKYFIVIRDGKSSKHPFPHPSLKLAIAEACRLSANFPDSSFSVYCFLFKIESGEGRNIKTYGTNKRTSRNNSSNGSEACGAADK
jgi:hypothetical protein